MSAAVPLPDANGYWHFIYVIYDPDTGEWYGGKHSTNDLHDGYRGSGWWPRLHPAHETLALEILEFFQDEREAYAAEALFVSFETIASDPLCRNETEGGRGLTIEGARRHFADPAVKAAHQKGIDRRATNASWRKAQAEGSRRRSATEAWRSAQAEGSARRSSDPEWQAAHAAFLSRINSDPTIRAAQTEGNRKFCASDVGRPIKLDVLARLRARPEWPSILSAAAEKAHAPAARKKAGQTNKTRNASRPPEYWAWRGERVRQGKAAAALAAQHGES